MTEKCGCGEEHTIETLHLEIEGNVESTGETVPIILSVSFPKGHGAVAVDMLRGIHLACDSILADLAAQGDGSAILAMVEKQDEQGDQK